jgi:glutaminyl-peptide cyclotransferase
MPRVVLLLAVAGSMVVTGTTPPPIWEEVSGEKALQHVRHLVEFGPRPAGSAAIERSRSYIEKELETCGWKTSRQTFTEATPRGAVNFVNLLAQFAGKNSDKAAPTFLLCSHYDTKIFASFDFVGANDGGSSTGLLLEIARVLALRPELARQVELVFFDGEEACENFSDTDGLYGSRHFAAALEAEKNRGRFRGGILFDMVGDRSLNITLPPNSPPEIARQMFASAEALKLRDHFTYFQGDILDDHTPLNSAGVPTIDLIDFDFPWWHTAEDKIDKLSAESLQQVGAVAMYYLAEFALK